MTSYLAVTMAIVVVTLIFVVITAAVAPVGPLRTTQPSTGARWVRPGPRKRIFTTVRNVFAT